MGTSISDAANSTSGSSRRNNNKHRRSQNRSSSLRSSQSSENGVNAATKGAISQDEETPLLNNRLHNNKKKNRRSESSSSTPILITPPPHKTVAWAAILASVLTLFLCACVLIGFVVNLWRGGPVTSSSTSGFSSWNLWWPPTNHNLQQQPTHQQLYDHRGRFILENYDVAPPFSDFLPALAGFYGKPLYAFYVNRGQGIAAFGTQSKDYPIMEFQSANKAYETTALRGFRTFLTIHERRDPTRKRRYISKKNNDEIGSVVEPFSPLTSQFFPQSQDSMEQQSVLPQRWMYIGSNEMQIQEVNPQHGIEANVTFFILPEEDFGAFVKRTTIRNMDSQLSLHFSMLDGLAKLEPAGGKLDDWLKHRGRTLESWMQVYSPHDGLEDSIKMPFFRLSTQPRDDAKVVAQEAGHWCLSVVEYANGEVALLPIIYDATAVFGQDTTMMRPLMLYTQSVQDIIHRSQYAAAKTPAAFSALANVTLEAGTQMSVTTYYGKASDMMHIPVIARRLLQKGFAPYKMSRSREIIEQITTSVKTHTSHHLFDRHVQQMFLDNSLRGGIPNILGDVDDDAKMRNVMEDDRLKVFHLFSRIHGDLERDYNDFNIAPTFFSEGPGNFRDIIQNRRNDVSFNPRVGAFNIETFVALIQADGYNPLTIEAAAFTIQDIDTCLRIAARAVGEADGHRAQREALAGILNGGPFRPGQLFQLMEDQHIELIISRQDFVDLVASVAKVNSIAVYDTGFWADHFTYVLDLINNFLEIYPDWEHRMLYQIEVPYFFSPAFVQPRDQKYMVSTTFDGRGKHIRQLNSTVIDEDKQLYRERFIKTSTNWFSLEADWQHDTNGVPFKSSIIGKLLVLGVLKFATRDPFGVGIEYEGGRPGWNDANNGLPSMIGSGFPELCELAILLRYIRDISKKFHDVIEIPTEAIQLMRTINEALLELSRQRGNWQWIRQKQDPFVVPSFFFEYWDKVATAREQYRVATKITFSGEVASLNWRDTVQIMDNWLDEISWGIAMAHDFGSIGEEDIGDGIIPPTYFSYKVVHWKDTGDYTGEGFRLVKPLQMEVQTFPLFLEGPTRLLKIVDDETAMTLYHKVRQSPLRDEVLKMYTVSASLKDQSVDMGREMGFPAGWYENQSVWLHMSYKFYLELLRKGFYEIFFDEMQQGGILPFMDPSLYGRSLMECSSFIASSAFEDPSIQGRGFLGRLSGATAEFMSMWVLMMLGPQTFSVDPHSGELQFQLLPALPRWLFDDQTFPGQAIISFKLFGTIDVRYFHKRGQENLYRVPASRYEVVLRDGQVLPVDGPSIPSPISEKIRRIVFVSSIDVFFEPD